MDQKRLENAHVKPAQLLLVAAELALALWVIWRYGLAPSPQLGTLLFLAVPLFAIHAVIPLPWRRPFLLAATFALLLYLVGTTVFVLVVVTGIAMVALCHLPIAFRFRVLLVLLVAIALAGVPFGWYSGGRHLSRAIPFLGAIFMFRMIIYLYDIRHEKPNTVTFTERISYFFLLPAPLFLFFPTLDYKVHLRCYYARPCSDIYQTGILWISRGVIHLALYRVVYQFFSPPAELVTDLGGVMSYCLSGYLIYLRVSGVFHIISGSLRLFGYDLPETHRLYFFASGFSDYWRRINIYWKDFMAKIIFFPTFSALHPTKFGRASKVAVATVAVFLATTVLHAYQTFWLRGDPTIHESDYWFWGFLCILVLINNLIDDRKPVTAGARPRDGWDFKGSLLLSTKVTMMFVFLCILWSLWSSQTLANFFGVMSQSTNAEPKHLITLFGFLTGAIALGTFGQWLHHRGLQIFVERPQPLRSVCITVIPPLLLAVVWEYHHRFGLPGKAGEMFDAVRIEQPNLKDQIQKERSYYEVLMGSAGDGGVADEKRVKAEKITDLRGLLYTPNFGPTIAWGAKWSTNRWGMRDRHYDKSKPAGTYRIAVSGASYVAGRGVADGKTFESVAEKQLNSQGQRPVEILNFAFSDTSTLQRLADLELRVLDFKPDLYLLFCHNGEEMRILRKLAGFVAAGEPDLKYPFLKDIVARAGVKAGDGETDIIRALSPFAAEVHRWIYGRIVALCEENGVTPVWVYLPLTQSHNRLHLAEPGRKVATESGMHTIILDGIYDGYDPAEITVGGGDTHPSETGHRLIADRLLEKLLENRKAIGLPEDVGANLP